MKTTYTPGPWELQAGRSIKTVSGDFYLTYGKDKHGNPNFRDFCELDRNAQLIAAAPELLAALENAANVIAGIATGDLQTIGKDSPALAQARSAIAKAKGGA